MVQKNILIAIALLLLCNFRVYGVQEELLCTPQSSVDNKTLVKNEFPVSSWLFCNEGQFVLAYGFPSKLTSEICFTSVISFKKLRETDVYEKVSTYESVAFLGRDLDCNTFDIWQYSELNEINILEEKQVMIAVNNWLKYASEVTKNRSTSLLKFSLWNRFFDTQTKKFIDILIKNKNFVVTSITPYFRSKEKDEYLLDITNELGSWTLKLKVKNNIVTSAHVTKVIN